MKNPYEDEAARYRDALQTLESLLHELEATSPPPPGPLTRRERKVTPAFIRRCIADLRSGEKRPIDPSKDANTLADELEADLKISAAMEHAAAVVQQLGNSLSSKLENKVQKALPQALMIYREARNLARTTGDEALMARVRRMDRALGRGPRRRERSRK